jgi:hypothetical protein
VARFTAFYGANVLYPAELRNLLMRLATGLFRATWSNGVHEEWREALLRKRPDLTRQKLEFRCFFDTAPAFQFSQSQHFQISLTDTFQSTSSPAQSAKLPPPLSSWY